jgi:tRNA modification GTPase
MLKLDDTIAAVATPSCSGAARSIIRISGLAAMDCMRRCFVPKDGWRGERTLLPHVLRGELTGAISVPCDAYLWPSRRSYTREPVAELHMFGSPPLVEMALGVLCSHGARLAEPGEFTLRAFLAGRIDLTQAEAVLGVIDAQDRGALDVAIAQLAGGLTGPLATFRGELVDLLADLEAGLDFVHEDIQFVTADEVARRLDDIRFRLQSLAETLAARSLVGELPRVAIIGWPNTGKSSLFNALAAGDRSIVSSAAGTTRDYLQCKLRFAGLDCVLIDTAGTDQAARLDSIDSAAQVMADSQRQQADLRILCIDASRPPNQWEYKQLCDDGEALVVLTKCDRPRTTSLDRPAIETSALNGQGLDRLPAAIAARLTAQPAGLAVASTAARCRDRMERAIDCVTKAHRLAELGTGDELVSAEVRHALDELGKITGAVYTEDVLDRIFSRFCIGK